MFTCGAVQVKGRGASGKGSWSNRMFDFFPVGFGVLIGSIIGGNAVFLYLVFADVIKISFVRLK